MELPRLYKIDAAGRKRVWWVTIYDDKYITHSGIVGMTIQEYEYPVEGVDTGDKRYRQQKDRVKFKAQSAWNLKNTKEGMVPEDEMKDAKDIYPLSPILAHDYVESKQPCKNGPWMVQYKYDGVRCISSFRNGEIELHSRGRKPWPHCNHIRKMVMKMLLSIPEEQRMNFHLDGELYVHGKSSEDIISIVKGENGIPHPDNENVQYIIYDLVDPDSQFTYQQRRKILDALFVDIPLPLILAPIIGNVENDEEIQTLLSKAEGEGYEGIILRNPNMIYKRGCKVRSHDLLKVKSFKDEEVTIIGASKGSGTHEGCIIFEVLMDDESGNQSKLKLNVNGHGNLDLRREMWNKWENDPTIYLNKRYTIKYKEIGQYGIPKFATGIGFRDPIDV